MPFPLFKEKPPYEAMPQESFVFKEWLKKLQKYLDTIANVYNAEQGSGAGAAALSLGGNDGGDGFDQDLFVFGGSGSSTPGTAGATGSQGPIGFAIDGVDGEEGMPIPGATGPAGGAGSGYTAFTKDLGNSKSGGTFDITGLSGLTADKYVDIVQTAAKITSKGDARDEAELDLITLTGYVVDAATIRAYWNCGGGYSFAAGTYAFAYLVSQ